MSRVSTLFGLGLLLVALAACSGSSVRQQKLLKSDPATLSAEQRVERDRALRLADEKRRAGRSAISGLTVGELEDMPPAPPLPTFVVQETTVAALQLHARLHAEAEATWCLPSTISVEQRVAYLMHAWQPGFEEVQARLAAIENGRHLLNQRYMKRMDEQTAWREQREVLDREWQRRLELEAMGIDTAVKR
jgi:hypothetical protein